MKGKLALFRPFLQRSGSCLRSISSSSYFLETLVSAPRTISSITEVAGRPLSTVHFLSDSAEIHFSSPFLQCRRNICSPSGGQSNIVLVKSEEDFNTLLSKTQDEALPAIFYFTAAWCGPCRFISPVLGELSAKYPSVTTYKIDIDQEGLHSTLTRLNITSVPTFHFFQDGKKAAEIIGADVARLKDTMEKLYKKD